MKSRSFILVGCLLAGAFLVGAIWASKELWPYEYLRVLRDKVRPADAPASGRRRIATDNVALQLDTFSVLEHVAIQPYGGGIDVFDDKVLIMSFRGEFLLYENQDDHRSVSRLDVSLDNGYDEFQKYAATRQILLDPEKLFRFIDVMYDRRGAASELLVSHHQWHADRECFTIRVSGLALAAGTSLQSQSAQSSDWRTVYDTQPCLPVVANTQYFAGDQSGGRIVPIDENSILFSVGDHAFDGWTIPESLPQDMTNDYGKILRVEIATGAASIVSIGHRNPQGLMIDSDNNIWSTEHGPRGGDELNLVRQGNNYGWPIVTYGSNYGMYRWPLAEIQNRHEGYERPLIAWIPSIGPSNLIQIDSFMAEWAGDLLVGSLRDRSLHRLRYREGRIIFDHRIVIDDRIRDLSQFSDGTIVVWTDDAEIVEIRPSNSAEPDLNDLVATLDETRRQQTLGIIGVCLQCHSSTPNADVAAGPNLWGVFGREIASTDFPGYSAGLKQHPGQWDEKTLDAFLSDVDGFANGSTMMFGGISDADVRATVVAYLKSLNSGPAK